MLRRLHANDPRKSDHVSDEDLVHYLDGELNPGKAQRVRRHLESCWRCRSRCQKTQASITEFADFRRRSDTVAPPKGWREFDIRLDQLEEASDDRPSLANLFSSAVLPRSRAALKFASLAVVACGVLLWVKSVTAPPVLAKELLARAQDAEQARLGQVSDPVIYQKLRVRGEGSGPQSSLVGALEIWNDPEQGPLRHRGENRFWEQLQHILRSNGMAGMPPLSAEAFSSWRSSAGSGRDEVTKMRLPSGGECLALTTVAAGPYGAWKIREARLVVRAGDWRPVSVRWTVQTEDGIRGFEFTELESRVVARNTLEPRLVARAPAETRRPADSPRGAGTALPPDRDRRQPAIESVLPAPSAAEVEAVEVEARYALHRAGDCLHGVIQVLRTAPGKVAVQGIVESAEQKRELLYALPDAPFVAIDIKVVEDLEKASPLPPPDEFSLQSITTSSAMALPIEAHLHRYFAETCQDEDIPAKVAAFLDDAVILAQSMRREAWALRRLAERYSQRRIDILPRSSRGILEIMIRDHIRRLRALAKRNRALVAPVLSWPGTRAAGIAGQPPPPRQGAYSSWNADCLSLADNVERVDDLARALFAGSGSVEAGPEQAARELVAALSQVQEDSAHFLAAAPYDFLSKRQVAASRGEQDAPGLQENRE